MQLVHYICFHCKQCQYHRSPQCRKFHPRDIIWMKTLGSYFDCRTIEWHVYLFTHACNVWLRRRQREVKQEKGRQRERWGEDSTDQSVPLCLRSLSALTCSVWRQWNSKFYTVWDTNWHSEPWVFLQYNLIKKQCQWVRNRSTINFDRQTDIKVFAISQHTGQMTKTSEPQLKKFLA